MSNWLTNLVNDHTTTEDTILDLCCGAGVVSDGFACKEITGIDIFEPYLAEYKKNVPNSKTILSDLSKTLLSNFEEKSYDIVVCLDGVEHLNKEESIILINNMEKIARKKIIIFTPEHAIDPERIVVNFSHGSWGIDGGDSFQIHKSAFSRNFFVDRGYSFHEISRQINQYDATPFYEMFYVKDLKINE